MQHLTNTDQNPERSNWKEILRAISCRGFTTCWWPTFPRCLSYGSFKSL